MSTKFLGGRRTQAPLLTIKRATPQNAARLFENKPPNKNGNANGKGGRLLSGAMYCCPPPALPIRFLAVAVKKNQSILRQSCAFQSQRHSRDW